MADVSEWGRVDLDLEATTHYLKTYGALPPVLAVGDRLISQHTRGDLRVEGFRAGGMLVDARRMEDGQVFSIPRREDPGGFVRGAQSDHPDREGGA